MTTRFLVFLSNLLFCGVNISLYLYSQGYVSSKGMYGELKRFIKPFTRLETSSNSLNSHLKILQKILIHDFRSIESYFQSIECSFRPVEQESSNDRDIQKLQDYFLAISIDQAKASTDRKCLILNFHFMKKYSPNSNIIITTYPCIYLYIQQQLPATLRILKRQECVWDS